MVVGRLVAREVGGLGAWLCAGGRPMLGLLLRVGTYRFFFRRRIQTNLTFLHFTSVLYNVYLHCSPPLWNSRSLLALSVNGINQIIVSPVLLLLE